MTVEVTSKREQAKPVRVFVLWTHTSGYMAENWRQFAAVPDLQVTGIAWRAELARNNASFGDEVMTSLDIQLVDPAETNLYRLASERIHAEQPDVVFVAGWGVSAYRRALQAVRHDRPQVVMAMDTPWRARPAQYFARYALTRYLRRVDAVLTAGLRSTDYAQRLGFSPDRIFSGLYSWDAQLRERCLALNATKDGGFLFVGRYVREKGVGTLVDAYAKYREMVSHPWELTCCGAGPLRSLLHGQRGIRDAGFVTPRDLPMYLARARVFVLPSNFEPWGVAIAEAMGCGLPGIVSDACGAAADLIEPGVSGFVVPTGSSEALAAQMVDCHRRPELLVEAGLQAARSASRFTPIEWATRFRQLVTTLLPGCALADAASPHEAHSTNT